ncbi:uncharacterized protein CANTADRAFT_96698 [Suhomyces tanzawaensis NRRL Y-17324]|uniref:25S rRNA adenine-N(1) methyltransferase n=1 Tax=Suhomyces tanzawaensis NRRL Y-17324 TaxID=984487 RepID=A0A1E4SEZ9_9ASCO|nr:uncharacterized protein CANTADRAFT_96698 [Suhomyces tanzawaensis NRRL Y-17324]ODV78046.1 hypothetical protein CANTADRAFT_96698 [Suhomyces tanzawaensis NRRL Y-17324]
MKRGLLRRPQTITGQAPTPKSLKPQKARQLIRRFHVLQKNKFSIISKLAKLENTEASLEDYKSKVLNSRTRGIYEQAYSSFKLAKSDKPIRLEELTQRDLVIELAKIDAEIDKRGGINAYQSASTQGQDSKRGGDSSKRLIEWLKEPAYLDKLDGPLNALEIGSLSASNVISTCGIFENVTRIDLNSQSPLILKQDFMERPLPKGDSEKFNLVSCSLVVNFVPSPKERGEMLHRITKFLKKPKQGSISSLFFVLPLPCIKNSRYFDEESLDKIMKHLGFERSAYYEAKKVAYWLYDWNGVVQKNGKFGKKELYPGSSRNNFCITLN